MAAKKGLAPARWATPVWWLRPLSCALPLVPCPRRKAIDATAGVVWPGERRAPRRREFEGGAAGADGRRPARLAVAFSRALRKPRTMSGK